MDYHVNMTWDAEACVWIATSEDIVGLVLEGGSADALIERARNAVPELLALNRQSPASSITFRFERSVGMSA